MSETSDFIQKLYYFSQQFLFEEADNYIEETFETWGNYNKYEQMDNVLYGIEFSKLNAKIARMVCYATFNYKKHLMMRKQFIEQAKEYYANTRALKGVR